MTKWLISPTAFKGTLSAWEAAERMASLLKQFKTVLCPLADGGDSTLECLIKGTNGKYFHAKVQGPLESMVASATFGVLGDEKTAVIEMAEAAGLKLLKKDQYDPLHATTYGVGELIKKALDLGYRKILVGLGGSATIDGGKGCLEALGMQFNAKLNDSNLDPRLKETEIVLLSDTTAPLTGKKGAAFVFGPQKGASVEQCQQLDQNLKQFGELLEEYTGKKLSAIEGSGAAGGLAAGLLALPHAQIYSGADVVMDILHFDQKLKDCDAVLSGEGKLDEQTLHGKIVSKIAERCEHYHKPLHLIVGKVEGKEDYFIKKLHLQSLHTLSQLENSFSSMLD